MYQGLSPVGYYLYLPFYCNQQYFLITLTHTRKSPRLKQYIYVYSYSVMFLFQALLTNTLIAALFVNGTKQPQNWLLIRCHSKETFPLLLTACDVTNEYDNGFTDILLDALSAPTPALVADMPHDAIVITMISAISHKYWLLTFIYN